MAEIKNSILAGIFFGTAIYLFTRSKTVQNQTQIENIEGQKLFIPAELIIL